MAQFVLDQSGDSNFLRDVVDESLTNINRFVPSVIEHVSSEAISAMQDVPGMAIEVGNGGLLDTTLGLPKQISSDAISVAQGVTTEVQHVGAVGESLAEIEQVSSEDLSASEKVAGVVAGLASDVRHSGISSASTTTGLIKDVSSQAISATQGVVTKLKHDGVVEEETKKLKYLAFVQVAIVHLVLLFINLYTKLKQKSGHLKPVLEIVERIVKTLLGMIFDKLFDTLYKRLKFVDDKVGELVTKIDSLVPSVIKQVLSKVICAARNALGKTVDVLISSGFLQQISTSVVPAAKGVASNVQQSELIPEEIQMLMYLKYFVIMQTPALRLLKLYFLVKKMLGPLKPVIDIIERVVISLYHKFFADMVKSLVKWVLIKFFGVPAEIFDIIEKVGNLNKIAELSKLGNFSKFNALGKIEDVSRLGDLSNLGDMSNVGDLSKFSSLSKIDALIPSGMKMVSTGVMSAAENLLGVSGSSTEVPDAGVLSTAVGFFKQAPSNAITGFQVMADVQHAEATTKIDLVAPLFKQASSVATSVAQKASRVIDGGDTEVQHTRLVSSPTRFIEQFSYGGISAIQKAPRVAQGLASAGVGSAASKLIVVTRRSPEVQHPTVVTALAKSFFDVVEPKVKRYAVSVWHKLDRIPLIPGVASAIVPTAAFFTKKHKKTVATGAGKGYKVASFLPLVPTDKIAKEE